MDTNEYERLKQFYIDVENKLTLDNIEQILDYLEIPIVHKTNKSWQLHTGCHNANALDGGANLTFYTENKHFFCFSECNTNYNIFTLVRQRYNILNEPKTSLQCLQLICEICGFDFNFSVKDIEVDKEIYNWKKDLNCYLSDNYDDSEDIVLYDDNILNCFQKLYHSEWLAEGITKPTMDKFGIRYYLYRQQIIIPCRDLYGSLVGIRIRNMITKPKYCSLKLVDNTEYKFPTGQFMYGLYENKKNIKESKTCILTESEKSVLLAESYLDKNIVLSLYGHSFNKSRLRQLLELGVENVIIALDWDYETKYNQDGTYTNEFLRYKDNIIKIVKQLKNYIPNIYITLNDNDDIKYYKQCIFDFGKEECLEFLEKKVKVK